MAIKTVQLKNFSVFSDLALDVSPGVNVLIGENGTGKTHFLKAVYTICVLSQNEHSFSFMDCVPLEHGNNGFMGKNRNEAVCISVAATEHGSIIKNTLFPISDVGNRALYELSYPSKAIPAVYIPAKDMLTHSKGLLEMADKYAGFPFDKTLLDIIRLAKHLHLKNLPELAATILPKLENMIGGRVDYDNDEFFIEKHDGRRINFAVEAEGFKKIGLLWQLLMNESITEGCVLLWDEPDANINPKFIPALVDSLLELARHGVQVFLGTHSYFLAKYFDVRQQPEDNVLVHSFYYEGDSVACETKEKFREIKHNSIMRAFDELVEEIYGISADDD